MASKRETHRDSTVRAEVLSRVVLQSHQLESVLAPEIPIAELVEFSDEFSGRPTPNWSREPDLAEAIRERLSRAIHVRIA